MKADLVQRLFRAIGERDLESVERLCRSVVAEERRKGHNDLAQRLEKLLQEPRKSEWPDEHKSSGGTMGTLPNRVWNEFYTLVPREALRHHMVLPPEVEGRLQRIEKEYKRRELLCTYGLRPRKKILLYGPPGNGKSLSAERLAWSTGLPLVKVRFDALFSSYLGETAGNLRKVFDLFKQQPVVLFLDECDTIARTRDERNDVGEMPRVVNTLLQFLEEYDLPGILIAATNLEQALDSAFFRRFDDIIELPRPGKKEILALLKLTLSSFGLAGGIAWSKLADSLLGKSAAFVVKAAQDGAKNAIFHDRRVVAQPDLEQAIRELHDGSVKRG